MTVQQAYDLLRKKAEEKLKKDPGNGRSWDQKNLESLVHELRVHQIELEIQNDELRRVQQILEDNRKRYFDLFDNAPVGYVIIDENGILKQFNKVFSNIIDQNALDSFSRAFADLLYKEDAAIFRARFKAILKNPEGKQIEARLKAGDSEYLHVILKPAVHEHRQGTNGKPTKDLMFAVIEVPEHLQSSGSSSSTQCTAGILAVCDQCRQIKTGNGEWQPLTAHVRKNPDTGIDCCVCPECKANP